jgi:hypothetical protein
MSLKWRRGADCNLKNREVSSYNINVQLYSEMHVFRQVRTHRFSYLHYLKRRNRFLILPDVLRPVFGRPAPWLRRFLPSALMGQAQENPPTFQPHPRFAFSERRETLLFLDEGTPPPPGNDQCPPRAARGAPTWSCPPPRAGSAVAGVLLARPCERAINILTRPAKLAIFFQARPVEGTPHSSPPSSGRGHESFHLISSSSTCGTWRSPASYSPGHASSLHHRTQPHVQPSNTQVPPDLRPLPSRAHCTRDKSDLGKEGRYLSELLNIVTF